eukprot:746395-Hanusia_phi.AAC.4
MQEEGDGEERKEAGMDRRSRGLTEKAGGSGREAGRVRHDLPGRQQEAVQQLLQGDLGSRTAESRRGKRLKEREGRGGEHDQGEEGRRGGGKRGTSSGAVRSLAGGGEELLSRSAMTSEQRVERNQQLQRKGVMSLVAADKYAEAMHAFNQLVRSVLSPFPPRPPTTTLSCLSSRSSPPPVTSVISEPTRGWRL